MLKNMSVVAKEAFVDKIFSLVCDWRGVRKEEILSGGRSPSVVFSRQLIAYLLKTKTSMSFPEIGVAMKISHSTAISGHDVIAELVARSSKFRRDLEKAQASYKPPAPT